MANKAQKEKQKKTLKSKSPAVTFRNFPELLIDRVNMKAAARGTGQAEYLIELFERETKELIEFQKKARREREDEKQKAGPEKA